jgi:hypothetical protein
MTGEDETLRAESSQIEQLLDELRSLVAAPAFSRVEDVIGRIVRMYGAGIARALAHARAAGADASRLDELCSPRCARSSGYPPARSCSSRSREAR